MNEAKRESKGPPSDVATSELFAIFMAQPIPHDIVDFPMKEKVLGESIGKVAIVPLGVEDLMICQKVAGEFTANFTKEKPKAGEESPHYQHIFANEASIQILWRALRDPKDKSLERKAFPAPSVLRHHFTGDLIAILLNMYMRTCVTRGPILAMMTKEEMDAWLDALEEGGAAHLLDSLTWAAMTDLLMHSVARSRALRSANISHGSRPGDLTPPAPSAPPADQLPPSPDGDDVPPVVVDVIEIPKE
jgi:hypothetical protein